MKRSLLAYLFQTAKLIVTSLHQRVTFQHFLPVILGEEVMTSFRLTLLEKVRTKKHEYIMTKIEKVVHPNRFLVRLRIFRFASADKLLKSSCSRPVFLNQGSINP